MPGVINADQVTRAFTVPFDGAQALMYYDALRNRNQQYQLQQQQHQQAEDYRKTTLLNNAFEGTDIASGTPYDEIGPAQVAAAKERLMKYMQENPNANYTDLWAQAHDATKGLATGISEAKRTQALIDQQVAQANKEYPQIDPTLLKSYYQTRAFRDPKTMKVMPSPNLNFYGNELIDPETRVNFLNPQAVAQGVQKELSEGFKPEAYPEYIDQRYPGAIMRGGKTRGYLDPQGNIITEPLKWDAPFESPAGTGGPAAASVFNKPLGAATTGDLAGLVPVNTKTQEMKGIPMGVLERLKAKPVFHDALVLERRRLKSEHGDMLKGASDDQIDQIAAAGLVHNYGSRDGIEFAKPDYSATKFEMGVQHQRFTEAVAAKNLQLHGMSVDLAYQNRQDRLNGGSPRAKAAQYLTTVPGMRALARSQVDPKAPEAVRKATQKAIDNARAIEKNNMENVSILGMNMPATNLTKWHGKPTYEPGTKTMVRLKTVKLPGTGQEVLLQIPVKKEPALLQTGVDRNGNPIFINNPNAGQESEDMSRVKIYGDFSQGMPPVISRLKATLGNQVINKDPDGVLQTFDRQWNAGQKADHQDDWQTPPVDNGNYDAPGLPDED